VRGSLGKRLAALTKGRADDPIEHVEVDAARLLGARLID